MTKLHSETVMIFASIILAATVVPIACWIGSTRRQPEPVVPVIVVETPEGIATISGDGAEYVLQSAFPIIIGNSFDYRQP